MQDVLVVVDLTRCHHCADGISHDFVPSLHGKKSPVSPFFNGGFHKSFILMNG